MIELPYPHKILWPNGRGHYMAVSREKKRHKLWAYHSMLATPVNFALKSMPGIRIVATFHPKTRHAVDKDNASASLKAYQDGIAAALGVDDKIFAEPKIIIADPVKGGSVSITLEAA